MKPTRVAESVLVGIAALAALSYCGDYVFVRYRIANPKAGNAFGNVQMQRLLAIPQKNGMTDYELDAQQPTMEMPCVHSLFPHMGYSPCWYLQRNSKKPIQMSILPRVASISWHCWATAASEYTMLS